MKTIYLKQIPNFPFLSPCFWKVTKTDNGCAVLTVTESTIETSIEDDFFEEVHFIKNTLCEDKECKEISREQFDKFYAKTIKIINELSAA